MKIKATLIVMALILAATSLISCKQTPRAMLTGEFKISSITTDRKMSADETEIWQQAMEDLKKSTVLVLNADGSMQETISGVTTKGSWEVFGEEGEEGETMVLKLVKENKSTVNMKLSELSASGFTYIEPDKATQSKTVITYTKN